MALTCTSSRILLTCTLFFLCWTHFFGILESKSVDRSIPYDARTIHGTRYLHSIKTKTFQNVFSFDSRKLTCFCPICMEDTESIDNCENINDNYVKPWKHNEINLKGKIPLISFEQLELEDIGISTDGDRISNLVREGNFMYTLIKLSFFILNIFYLNVKYIYESCLIQ